MGYKFGITPAFDCPYLEAKTARNLVLWPDQAVNFATVSELNLNGFRRSGSQIYRPKCESCTGCVSTRVVVDRFVLKRRFNRILKAATGFSLLYSEVFDTKEMYPLYAKYISVRHRDGDMYPPNEADFEKFLGSQHSFVRYLKLYDQDTLIGVMVVDHLADGLSAVYSFFDPDYERKSIGVLLILKLIELTKLQNLDYAYLGYYVEGCDKMAYKTDFRPVQAFNGLKWV